MLAKKFDDRDRALSGGSEHAGQHVDGDCSGCAVEGDHSSTQILAALNRTAHRAAGTEHPLNQCGVSNPIWRLSEQFPFIVSASSTTEMVDLSYSSETQARHRPNSRCSRRDAEHKIVDAQTGTAKYTGYPPWHRYLFRCCRDRFGTAPRVAMPSTQIAIAPVTAASTVQPAGKSHGKDKGNRKCS